MYKVNVKGLNVIREYFRQHHKHGMPSDARVCAYADVIEDSLSRGKGPELLIRARDTRKGEALTLTLSSDCVDMAITETDRELFAHHVAPRFGLDASHPYNDAQIQIWIDKYASSKS